MPIQVLKREIAELIAAGEVVERPASVVKELTENAVDAGAKKIEVELLRNGLESIRVTDDGFGIRREEIKTAFLRHATSKVSKADDLDNIGTLGFRGEALAAISAVSRVRMVTKTKDETFAYEYRLEGGEEISFGEAAGGDGTTIVVRDLFYNTPARMKFLKKDASEGAAVQDITEQLALSHPDVAFRLIRDGRTAVSTPGNGELISAIHAIFPKEISGSLLKVSGRNRPVSVEGYIGKPDVSRNSRGFQHTFVNGRYVRSGTVSAAVEQAFRNLRMTGRFPVFVLNILMPYEDVDVNVHPTKTEVRFKNDRDVFSAVHHAAAEALRRDVSVPIGERMEVSEVSSMERGEPDAVPVLPLHTAHMSSRESPGPGKEKTVAGRPSFLAYQSEEQPKERTSPLRQTLSAGEGEYRRSPSPATPPCVSRVNLSIDPEERRELGSGLRIVGEIFSTYILAEYKEDFFLIDKHAAHERILFEKFRTEKLHSARQILLQPEIIAVSPVEKEALLSSSEQLIRVGFLVEEFGVSEVAVREVPTYFPGKDLPNAILDLAGQLLRYSDELETEETAWLLHSVSCRAAIKAGHRTTTREMISIAEKILFESIPKYCPHGRPVYWAMTKKEIEKQFGRIQ